MKKKGFSLIELILTVGLLGLSIIFGISLFSAHAKERKKIESLMVASSYGRQFFDLRSKVVQAATQTDFTAFPSADGTIHNVNGQEAYQSIAIQANSPVCSSIKETIQVECVPKHPQINPIDLSQISGATSVFVSCAPSDCGSAGGILGKKGKLPRIRVTRTVKKRDAAGNCLTDTQDVDTFFPQSELNLSSSGRDGNPVAAVVCINTPVGAKLEVDGVHCGTPLAVGKNFPDCIDCERSKNDYPPAKQTLWDTSCPLYRDFSLSVFMITQIDQDKFDLAHQVASFPRPGLSDPTAPKILGPAGK